MMFQLTDQEKKVVLFVCIVLGGGTALEVSFNVFPRWHSVVSIISNDVFYPKVNVNTASLEELVAIPHIGIERAKRIVEARSAGGRFQSLEDLTRAGLGAGMLKRVGKYLSF